MIPKILSFGEIIWDVYESEELIGGAPLNFAAHAKGCGAKSFMVSAVGGDRLGGNALDLIKAFGVDASCVKVAPFQTGKCEVTLNESGVPTYNVLSNVAFDNIILSDTDIEKINAISFDALYFGTLIQRSEVSRAALEKLCKSCSFKEIICDVNLRKNCYSSDSALFCLENASILKISDEEEPLLREMGLYSAESGNCESIAKSIAAAYPNIKIIVITLGANGSFVYDTQTASGFLCGGEKVEVVSTVGAGDSYTAAFCVSFLLGEGAKTAAKKATELSAYVVAHKAAIPQ